MVCHVYILVKCYYKIIPIFVKNIPFRTVFLQVHTRMSAKILTKWKPSQTFSHMQQTQCIKRILFQTFSQSQQHFI